MPQPRFAAVAALTLLCIAGTGHATIISWNTDDGNWLHAPNWSPMVLPGPGDEVFIGNTLAAENAQVQLNGSASIDRLTISDGIWLNVNGTLLDVAGNTLVTGSNVVQVDPVINRPSMLRVYGGGGLTRHFATEGQLNLSFGAWLWLEDYAWVEVGDLLIVNSQSVLWGEGRITFSDSGTVLVNDGTIMRPSANPGNSLDFVAPNGRFDLDGPVGNGVLRVDATGAGQNYNMTFVGLGLANHFEGGASIAGGNQLTFNLTEGWDLGVDGLLSFFRGSGGTARVGGTTARLRGTVNVSGGVEPTHARFHGGAVIYDTAGIHIGMNSNLRFQSASTVSILGGTFNVGNGGTLAFEDPVTFSGTSAFHTVDMNPANGAVRFIDNVTFNTANVTLDGYSSFVLDADVVGTTTINAGGIVLDSIGLSTWTMDRPLTINAERLGATFGDQHTTADFVINANSFLLNPGKLTVNITEPGMNRWTAYGNITVHGPVGDAFSTSLDSNVAVDLRGVVTINGNTVFDAPVWLRNIAPGDTAIVVINDGYLRLRGGSIVDTNRMALGTILGPGELRADAGKALFGSGLIQAPVRFAGNSELRAESGLLQLSGAIVDMGILGTHNDTAILHVLNPWNTAVTDLVELRGGELRGSDIANDGPGGIVGRGLVSAAVDNNTRLAAIDGELVVSNNLNNWHGSAKTGQLHAMAGDLTIIGQTGPEGFSSGIAIHNGHKLTITGFDLDLRPGSILAFADGELHADTTQTLGGFVSILGAEAHLFTDAVFTSTADTALGARLNLRGDTNVHSSAAFNGDADLTSHVTGTLTLGHESSVDVDLRALGELVIEDGIGHARVTGNAMSLTLLALELAGNVPALHDRLFVTDTITLRGTVLVELLGYDPVAGDIFDVLDFTTFVNAGYAFDLPALSPGLVWDTSHFETVGELRVLVPEPASLVTLALGCVALLRRHTSTRRGASTATARLTCRVLWPGRCQGGTSPARVPTAR